MFAVQVYTSLLVHFLKEKEIEKGRGSSPDDEMREL